MVDLTSRRGFIQAGLGVGLGAMFGGPLFAQDSWPSAPVKVVVPFIPGGATDIVARVLAEGLQKTFGKAFVIDNKGGAGGSIGTAMVAQAKPDGLTITVGLSSSLLLNQFQYRNLAYDPRTDLTLVSLLARAPMVVAVPVSSPANNMAELREHLTKNKGKGFYGSYGNGSYAHLMQEHLNQDWQVDMTHIPYHGEAAVLNALLSDEIDVALCSGVTAVAQAKAGKIRVLGAVAAERMDIFPDVPTLVEQGMTDPEYLLIGWVGMAAPAKTPPAIIEQLSQGVATLIQSDSVQMRLKELGLTPVGNSPQEFREIYDSEFDVWKKLFESSGAEVQG